MEKFHIHAPDLFLLSIFVPLYHGHLGRVFSRDCTGKMPVLQSNYTINALSIVVTGRIFSASASLPGLSISAKVASLPNSTAG